MLTQLGRQGRVQSEGALAEKCLDTGLMVTAHNRGLTLGIINLREMSKYKDANRTVKMAVWLRRVLAEENTWKYNFSN